MVLPLPQTTLMHPTKVPQPGRHESWVYEEKGALCSEPRGYRMANLERGFRRLTLAASILLMLPFLGATIPSFLAGDGPAIVFGLGLTVLAFLLPWLLFVVGRWIARGFRD
jgi:hypothetical protein